MAKVVALGPAGRLRAPVSGFGNAPATSTRDERLGHGTARHVRERLGLGTSRNDTCPMCIHRYRAQLAAMNAAHVLSVRSSSRLKNEEALLRTTPPLTLEIISELLS